MPTALEVFLSMLPPSSLDPIIPATISESGAAFIKFFMKNDARSIYKMDIWTIQEPSILLIAAFHMTNILWYTKNLAKIEEYINYIKEQCSADQAITSYLMRYVGIYGYNGNVGAAATDNGECLTKLSAVIRCAAVYSMMPERYKDAIMSLRTLLNTLSRHESCAGGCELCLQSNFLYYKLFMVFCIGSDVADDTNVYDVIFRMVGIRNLGNKSELSKHYEICNQLDPDCEFVPPVWKNYHNMLINPTDAASYVRIVEDYTGSTVFQDPELVATAQIRFINYVHHDLMHKLIEVPEGSEYFVNVVNQKYEAVASFVSTITLTSSKPYVDYFSRDSYCWFKVFIDGSVDNLNEYLNMSLEKYKTTVFANDCFILASNIIYCYRRLKRHEDVLKFYFANERVILKGMDSAAHGTRCKILIYIALAEATEELGCDAHAVVLASRCIKYGSPTLAEFAARVRKRQDTIAMITRRSYFTIWGVRENIEDECLICYSGFRLGMYAVFCNCCRKYIGHAGCIGEYIQHERNYYNITCPHCRAISGNQFLWRMERMRAIPAVTVAAPAPAAPAAIEQESVVPAVEAEPVVPAVVEEEPVAVAAAPIVVEQAVLAIPAPVLRCSNARCTNVSTCPNCASCPEHCTCPSQTIERRVNNRGTRSQRRSHPY